MKKHFITTTALAGFFAIGIAGAPFAQGVNPSAPGSAAGGTMAQGGTQGGAAGGTQGGATTPGGQTGTMGGTAAPGGQTGTQGGATTPGGQMGTQGGQRGTQGGDATRPGQGTPGGATTPGSQRGTQGGSLMQNQPILAQATTPGQTGTQGGQAGTQGSGAAGTQGGQAGTQRGTTTPGTDRGALGGATTPGAQTGTQGGTPGGATTPGGQMGTQGGQTGTQGDATRPGHGTPGGATTPGGQRGTQGGSLLLDRQFIAQVSMQGQAGAQQGQMGAQPGMTGAPQAGATGQRDPMRPGGAAPGQQATMNEEQIRGMLAARGYTDISGIERDGDHFKVSEAKRYGRDVEDIRVNARTGQVQDEARLNEEQARNLLEQRGFTQVNDVSSDGGTFTAQAQRDGREMRVRIDGNTGAVIPQPASN